MKSILLTITLVLTSCTSKQDLSWHWTQVNSYQNYVDGKIEKEHFKGHKYFDGEPDIKSHLHSLEKASQIMSIDLVFPTIPKSKKVTKLWMNYCSNVKEIIYGEANPEYVDFKTKGVQPFHMKLWFKPSAKDHVQKLIKLIEEKGKL